MLNQFRILVQLIIIVCILGACAIPVTTRPQERPTESARPFAKLSKKEAKQIEGLWSMFNLWRSSIFFDESNKENFSYLLSSYAKDFGVSLQPDLLNQMDDRADTDKVANLLVQGLQQKRGVAARAFFEIQFYLDESVKAIIATRNFTAIVQAKKARQTAVKYLAQAVDLAKRFDPNNEIVGKGENVLQDLLAPNGNLGSISDSIEQWSETIIYLVQGETEPTPTPESIGPVGIDISIQLPIGDPTRGEELMTEVGCRGCHGKGTLGPAFRSIDTLDGKGIGIRAQIEWTKPEYTGEAKSAAEYLLESIVVPNVYVLTGYHSNVHPQNYKETLSTLDTAHLIAYMLAQK